VRSISGYGALALQLLILTAARTGEIVRARWDEFDLDAKVWTIPAARMKARREHRVPLADPALDVLRELWEVRRGHFLFPSHDASRHASKMLMDHVVKRLGHRVTVHGFRSSFRDWASEQTSFPREVIEMSLAHVVGSTTERAYARSSLFERRRQLMGMWGNFCSKPLSAEIVPLRR
jgi:integrase